LPDCESRGWALIYRFAEFALDVKPCNLRRNGVLHQIKRICSAFVLTLLWQIVDFAVFYGIPESIFQ
jgi:hypothetical protein